jgi:hypothetical protein
MNGIQLSEEVGRHGCKGFRGLLTQMLLPRQFRKQTTHLSIDVFRVTERIPLLGHPNGTDRSSPIVHILKQVPMDREVMIVIQRT